MSIKAESYNSRVLQVQNEKERGKYSVLPESRRTASNSTGSNRRGENHFVEQDLSRYLMSKQLYETNWSIPFLFRNIHFVK